MIILGLNAFHADSSAALGFTMDCPDHTVLTELKRSKFASSEKDYISALKQFGLSGRARILDFGCS
jgi:hypothetical protein